MTTAYPEKKGSGDFSLSKVFAEQFVQKAWDGSSSEKELEDLQAAVALSAIEAVYGEDIAIRLAERVMELMHKKIKEYNDEKPQ